MGELLASLRWQLNQGMNEEPRVDEFSVDLRDECDSFDDFAKTAIPYATGYAGGTGWGIVDISWGKKRITFRRTV